MCVFLAFGCGVLWVTVCAAWDLQAREAAAKKKEEAEAAAAKKAAKQEAA